MKKWVKRTIWSVVISIGTLTVLSLTAIAVVVNFIFTPEKLTPMVERVADQHLDAKLRFGSVELTFFSTFPDFGLRLTDGSLITTALPQDSTGFMQPISDTIVSFSGVDIVVNPIALLKDNNIVVRRVELTQPNIYAFVDPHGRANWDILKPFDVATDTTMAGDSAAFNSQIAISGVRISDGKFTFDNRQSGLFTYADSIRLDLRGNLTKELSDIDLSTSLRNGLVWHNNELIFKQISLGLETTASIDSTQIVVQKASVELNRIRLGLGGRIDRDSVDLTFGLEVPSLATVLAIAPPSIIKPTTAKGLKSTGSVNINGKVSGGYTGGLLPTLRATIDIENATAHYRNMPVGIDNLSMSALMMLDLNHRHNSYISLQKFHFAGAQTKIDVSGRIDNLFGNQSVVAQARGRVDFGSLSNIFPLASGVELGGTLDVNLRGATSRRQIQRGDYAHIQADGELSLRDVVLRATADNFDFTTKEAKFGFVNGPDSVLSITSQLSNLALKLDKRLSVDLQRATASLAGRAANDSTSSLMGEVGYNSLHIAAQGDTLELHSAATIAKVDLSRSLRATFHTDSMSLRADRTRAELAEAGFDMTLTRGSFASDLGFAGLKLETPAIPLPISMPATKLNIRNDSITLNGTKLVVGNSQVSLTGQLSGLIAASKGEGPLVVRAALRSPLVDLTQIIHALAKTAPTSTTAASTSTTAAPTGDSAANNNASSELETFVVPSLIDFDLQTSISRVEFGKLLLDDIHGHVVAKNGEVYLDGLALSALGAKLRTSLRYAAQSSSSAQAAFDLKAKDIDVKSIIELIPSIDTLIPMLRSFEGVVDFSIASQAAIGSNMSIKINDIKAAVSIHGVNLVLLDGETFAEISKMLLFKNKGLNPVDSLSVQMAVTDGKVEIFPFLLQIDRYRVAVGGEHQLNNNFNYHISVLKSPVPFKLGINVSGTLDKMKVGIGKTQYKFLDDPTRSAVLNPSFVKLRDRIVEQAGI